MNNTYNNPTVKFPFKGDGPRVLLIRLPYSYEIYHSTYKNKFKVGDKQVEPPLALMQIGSYALKSGADIRIIDGEAENLSLSEITERVLIYQPDIVGITSTTPESEGVMILSQKIKDIMPKVITVAGGAHATHVPWKFLEESNVIDYVIMYEGEKSFSALVKNDTELLNEYTMNARLLLEEKGVTYKKYFSKILLGPSMSANELDENLALREEPYIDSSHYYHAHPSFGLVKLESIETARGCPFGCTFCSSARSGLGQRSVEGVLEEIVYINSLLKKKQEKGCILFLDDTLTVNRARSIEIFEGMLKRQINVDFKSFTRANTIATKNGINEDIKFARLMKKAGSSILSFGIESGSEKINADMQKNVSLDDYRNAYKILEIVGFEERRGSFIVGHPFESEENIKESIDFALELKLQRIGVNIMTPYPGTKVYEYAQEGKGIYFEENANDYSQYLRWGKSVVSTEYLSAKDLELWHKKFLMKVYSSYHPLRHSVMSALGGNLSGYFHRPVIKALKQRTQMYFKNNGSGNETVDHSRYNHKKWGDPHITKQDCIEVLSRLYGMKRSRVQI